MNRPLLKWGLLFAAAVLVLATLYYDNLPRNIHQHETIVLGADRLAPGSQAALRVIVRDMHDAAPLAGATINVALQAPNDQPPLPLYTGTTDANGSANVSFRVPDNLAPDQKLIVETQSPLGSDRLQPPIKIERDYRILLTTDKPLYQPGQVIHLRALALSAFDRKSAANQAIEFFIADGKGNKVFRQTLTTSDYGVASTDFQLANEVNTGAYKITAQISSTQSEKTVTVEHYVLPKFAVKLSTDRSFYQPGQPVRASLNANYFFGKPVSRGQVTIEGYTFDVERTVTFKTQGTTDVNGNFEFEFNLPAQIVGTELDKGLGRFYLQASVIDQAQHSETSNLSLPVSSSPIVIRAIPESGQFRPGVENIVYVLTSTPDGAPIETDLAVNFIDPVQTITAHTDPYGLVEVRYTPRNSRQNFGVEARAANGAHAVQQFKLDGDPFGSTILLRPARPIYRVGDTMPLTILTSQSSGSVYLDMVRAGQTVSTRSVEIKEGRAEVAVDLTPDLDGTLELHAYQLLRDGHISRDTRLVIVDAAADLDVDLKADRDVYRPGDQAGLDIAVRRANGSGAPSAVGLAIVDESVFALAEQDPGFAKLYFLLEQELLEPKYDLHGFSLIGSVRNPSTDDPILRDAQATAARASLAEALPANIGFSMLLNSHDDIIQRAYRTQQTYFAALNETLLLASVVMAGVIAWYAGQSLHERRRLGRSIVFTIVGSVLVIALLQSASYRYNWVILIGLGLSIPIGLLTLIVLAAQRKDRSLRRAVGLLVLYIVVALAIGFTGARSGFGGFDMEWFALAGVGLVALSFALLLVGEVTGGCGTSAISMLLVIVLIWSSGCAPASMPSAAPRELAAQLTQPALDRVSQTTSATTTEQPRLRQYFPETLLWRPDAITDENGRLHVDVPIADSITTWRMTALASSRDGRIGSATGGLRVFQDFFIDLDLPAALTVGDEVAIPIGVFNYLPNQQTVRLEVAPADWFELLDEPTKEMNIAANDVNVAYFRIRAKAFGSRPFKVTAYGSQMSDAIQKMVRVAPDGRPFTFAQSDRLNANTTIQRTINIPAQAIPGTQAITVKIYPGIVSQVVEGLDSILRMPNGCFEQTSSSTYPDVLVLDYLRATNQASPEVQMKAEQYINLGYQRLTTFEVPGGGFSLFGHPPADRMLTAYGLQEFGDMQRVHDVDPELIKRAAEWLMAQQQADGSWANDDGLHHENTWRNLKNDRLPITAYVVWSLTDAGFGRDPRVQRGLNYVRAHVAEATDAYVLALTANALVAVDRAASGEGTVQIDSSAQAALDRLAEMAQSNDQAAAWSSGVATYMGSTGRSGSIETTALAALALLRANAHPQLANEALTWLVQQKDNFGTWYSTQATVLALKALIQSVRSGAENVNATVTVRLDSGQPRTIQVTRENFDVTQLLAFNDLPAGQDHTIEISTSGEGNLTYQIAGSYYLPWSEVPSSAEKVEPVTIDVKYDRSQLKVNDSVKVNVTVRMNQPDAQAESALIDLGMPPGFTVQTEDLAALIAKDKDGPADSAGATIQRYELTGRQVLVYIGNLSGAQPLTFSYQLKAKFPLIAQSPASSVYDYYNPDVAGEARPQVLTVNP